MVIVVCGREAQKQKWVSGLEMVQPLHTQTGGQTDVVYSIHVSV